MQTQLDESQQRNKKITEQNRETQLNERMEYEAIINQLNKTNTSLEEDLKKIKNELSLKEDELRRKSTETNNTVNTKSDLKVNAEHLENELKEKDNKLSEIKKKLEEKET